LSSHLRTSAVAAAIGVRVQPEPCAACACFWAFENLWTQPPCAELQRLQVGRAIGKQGLSARVHELWGDHERRRRRPFPSRYTAPPRLNPWSSLGLRIRVAAFVMQTLVQSYFFPVCAAAELRFPTAPSAWILLTPQDEMQRILLRGMHPIVGLLRSAVSVQATHWLIDNFNFVLGINGTCFERLAFF